ncbi:MAG: tetratricopeptide repeat protein [Phycisphaerae bacterium]
MTQTEAQGGTSDGKGKAFFDRADEVAETGNWDFAVELYLEGLRREPDNLQRGHKPLRNVALNRKAQGGKGPGMIDKFKYRPGKDPLENLINAEYLLSKEPGSVEYLEQALKAAQSLGLPEVAQWLCDILLEAMRQASKPSKRVLMRLTEAYEQQQNYSKAIQAADMASRIDPSDEAVADKLKDLSAQYTIHKGRYDQEGDFQRAVRDLDKQKELIEEDAVVKDQSYFEKQIERTRKEYEADPTTPGKISAYVDALVKTEDEQYENKALEVLQKAWEQTKQYQFKLRMGDIKIRQMTRRHRELLNEGKKDEAAQAAREQLEFELKEYAERAKNYPTDLGIKYELGRRHYMAGNYDDAIAMLQQSQRDPRRQALSMIFLGLAFSKKQWYREAADTFKRLLENVEMGEERTKEARYYYGRTLEQMGELEAAADEYSEVAQIDFQYKDVRDRLEQLRNKLRQQGGEEK